MNRTVLGGLIVSLCLLVIGVAALWGISEYNSIVESQQVTEPRWEKREFMGTLNRITYQHYAAYRSVSHTILHFDQEPVSVDGHHMYEVGVIYRVIYWFDLTGEYMSKLITAEKGN